MKIKKYLAPSILIVISLILNGCSLIGLGIGAVTDAIKPDYKAVKYGHSQNLKKGDEIKISLKKGDSIVGNFLKFEPPFQNTYFYRYQNYLKSFHISDQFPRLDEEIVIFTTDAEKKEGNFLGFGKEDIFYQGKQSLIEHIQLRKVKRITSANGYLFKINRISEFIQKPDFPIFDKSELTNLPKLFLFTKQATKSFSLDEIEQVALETDKNGKMTGFLVGLPIDLFILYRIITNPPGVSLSGTW